MKKSGLLLLLLLALSLAASAKPRKVYMTYILHGNMNYDRYVRPVIWEEFPRIYDNLLTFMDEHPDFKGQLQFSGQTFGSMEQAAPEVIAHAKAIHARGQLNFTGTFYSEPVNVNMDGETNFRCAWLGTKIIEDAIGETDGFYLQERAYHPQLPWILNHAHVSWTPVITGDDAFFPFRLQGMDGSLSVCVPITRDNVIEKIKQAPKNALISIEEDYEIPQTFTRAYMEVDQFNKSQKDIVVEWITVKEYIRRFGVKPALYVDHSAKADDLDKGTYSRWTADPLDIILQDETVRAMNLFRLANAMDALASVRDGVRLDVPFAESGITLVEDPLAWNIERADLYPSHEKYLLRRGETTVLSKAEHLLLWAVNSDAKGWFPLYEKRRERTNALQNSARLSRHVIDKAVDRLGAGMAPKDYDAYYLLLNLEAARTVRLALDLPAAAELYDVADGTLLPGHCVYDGASCRLEAEVALPPFGYKVVGTKPAAPKADCWKEGSAISDGKMSLSVHEECVHLVAGSQVADLRFDDFQLMVLAHMDRGPGDGAWRAAKPYGPIRVSVNEGGLYPKLKVERQLDWLVHLQQVFTLQDGSVRCEMRFEFPHPTVVRKGGRGPIGKNIFNPEGLDLIVDTHGGGTVGYDIPFGISTFDRSGTHHFCLLSGCFLQQEAGGWLICPQTGEQAFSADIDSGRLTFYLGASTTSGPVREMGLRFRNPTDVEHDVEWYAEPFHGCYDHVLTFQPFEGSWTAAHVPAAMRALSQDVYVRPIKPSAAAASVPYTASWVENVPQQVDITSVYDQDGTLLVRLNEREGAPVQAGIRVLGKECAGDVPPFGITVLTR